MEVIKLFKSQGQNVFFLVVYHGTVRAREQLQRILTFGYIRDERRTSNHIHGIILDLKQ